MANWFYYDANGVKQGPIAGHKLKMLASHGIVKEETLLEREDGKLATANKVKGLEFVETKKSEEPPAVIKPDEPSAIEGIYRVSPDFPIPSGGFDFSGLTSQGELPPGYDPFAHSPAPPAPERVVSSTTNFATPDITIFVAAGIALLSFFLPWIEAIIPFAGHVSRNGFSEYAFLLGILFVFPVWMAVLKKRSPQCNTISLVCAGIGILLGICYIFGRIPDQQVGFGVRTSDMIKLQIGVYAFIVACIVLIVGAAMQFGLAPRRKKSKDKTLSATTKRSPALLFGSLFTLCIILIIGGIFVSGSNMPSSEQEQQAGKNSQPIMMSASGLYYSYSEDSSKADKQYKNKRLRVQGNFRLKRRDSVGTPLILLGTRDMMPGGVACAFFGNLPLISTGKNITVEGKCVGTQGNFVMLTNCSVEVDGVVWKE